MNPIRAAKAVGRMLSALGPYHLARFLYARSIRHTQRFSLTSPHATHPVWCRPDTSDITVFYQIFGHREYRCLDHVQNPKLIIDCGANVGYSAAYFLSRFPGVKLIAIEPDRYNYATLRDNLSPYENWEAINSGVWVKSTGLVMSESGSGSGEEWGRQVREARHGEIAQMTAVNMADVIGDQRVGILKIDIEGAEDLIFQSHVPWLSQIDNVTIEIHSQWGAREIPKILGSHGFSVSKCDEVLVGTRRTGAR